ncbi:hypothetical protein GQ600_18045 [Phytophthora cactorum]|nr:hypothetical protein GQ600_18045 [Phytophthora cactorum]
MAGKLSLRVRAVIPLPSATLPALAWANSCRLRVKLMKASPVETRFDLSLLITLRKCKRKTAQELGDDAGGHGEAVRRDAARDGGEVKDAEVPTVGAASECKVADGDDGTPARESRDDAGDSNARGDQVIEDPVTKDDASKEGADATVMLMQKAKNGKSPAETPVSVLNADNVAIGLTLLVVNVAFCVLAGRWRGRQQRLYCEQRHQSGHWCYARGQAVGDRDNISPDGDQARKHMCSVRQINGTVVRVLTLLYVNVVLLTLLVAVPSVQTSQGKGRAKRGESKPIESRYGIKDDVKAPPVLAPRRRQKHLVTCKDDERRETCDEKDKGEESSDGEPPTYLQFLEEKLPRERHSKTKPEREAMIAAHVNVDNYVGPVPRKGYASWKSWEASIAVHTASSIAFARRRTSMSTIGMFAHSAVLTCY